VLTDIKDEMTGHGFRATARTILDEVLQVRPDIIEHQLAHFRGMEKLWHDFTADVQKFREGKQ
jgi:hypothetical protein